MERESLVAVLTMLFGGAALQPLAFWSSRALQAATSAELERRTWNRLWIPIVPILFVAAGLVGWALKEPDPVRDPLNPVVLLALWAPFAFIFARAALRAAWALVRRPVECGISTVGLVQPQVVFSPFLAKKLPEREIGAAIAHERAHALHRDPLRIWLAQFVTDLQWPWPFAQRRLETWLVALELARDDEARESGADGVDLAAAVLASIRFLRRIPQHERAPLDGSSFAHARLIGYPDILRERFSRLLAPRPRAPRAGVAGFPSFRSAVLLLVPLLLMTIALGAAYGERLIHPLLALTL